MVGFEREFKNKSATARMHMLVAAGASLFAGTSAINTTVSGLGDPSRIMSGIVSGVGFLGAAIIFKIDNAEVRGLTTASGIWVVAGLGTAVGYGYYTIGGVTAALVLVIQHGLFFFLKPSWWKQVCRCMCDESVFEKEDDDPGRRQSDEPEEASSDDKRDTSPP